MNVHDEFTITHYIPNSRAGKEFVVVKDENDIVVFNIQTRAYLGLQVRDSLILIFIQRKPRFERG